MKQHTSDFKEEIKNLGRQLDSTLTFGNTTLSEELYSVTPSFEGAILKSVMKQLTIESSVDVPRETIVNYKLGLLVNGSYEYMDYGNYVVYSSEKEEDKNLYKILCYDKLLYSMIPYAGVEGTFPMTVREYLTAVCNKLGITFADENTNFANYNRVIPADPYIGLEYTYRDVLDELAQVTASTICMNNNDEMEVRYIEEENAIYNTVEGTSLTITDADTSRKANIVEIQGNTIQDGTPSPDNEVKVQNVTGDNYIVVSNANLFNPNGTSKTVSGVSLTNNNDGTYTANGTATASVSIPLILDPETIKLKANSSYVWSIEVLSGSSSGNVSFPVAVRKDDGTTMYNYLSVRPNTEKYSDKKTSTENLTVREVAMYVPNGVTINNLIFRLQLKEDTTVTDYIEHQGKKYRVDLGGKNKFNTNQRSTTWKSIVVEESSRKVVLKPEIATGSGYVRYTINNIKPSTNYVFSCEEIQIINSSINTKGQIYIREYNSSDTMHYISVVNSDNLSRAFTTQSDTVKIGLDVYATTGAEADYQNMQIRYINIQLEEGTQKTDFSPYVNNPIELCKIGTYRDYVYKSNNKWYKHTVIGKVVLDNNSNIRIQDIITTNNKFIWRYSNVIDMAGTGTRSNIYSNYFVGNTNVYGANDLIGAYVNSSNQTNFAMLLSSIGATTSSTTAEILVLLKTWLSSYNVLLYYPLTEPLEEEITNENLIAQLEELQRITMYDNLTYIIYSGNVEGTISLKYFKGLDFDDVIDEEYLKDVNVNFAEKYGKINSIVLSRSGESDNVYLQDEESVETYGLCELKIIDNQIMNNNDRSDYLPDILAQLDGLEYYINDFSSTGILYYDLCDRYGVKIGDKTYSCIMFNDEVNVTTGIEEFIYTDMPEQSQTDYTKADKTDRKINQTYLIVDKQNQKIESLITQIGDRSEKTTSITQDIDGINATVQDIEDLTIDGETNTANLEIQDVNQCEPIEIRIHPILESIYYLYPNAKLYPSNQTFLRSRILRFTRTYVDGVEERTEDIDYALPDDLLWFDNETYDELYLDYDKQICQVTKRCGLNANGEIYKLSSVIIKSFEYPTIQLKSGNYEIKLLNCQTGYIYAKLIRQNTFTERFATQAQLQSEIKQTSNEIRLSLNEKLDNEDFTGANIVLAINQDTSSAIINADKVSLEGKVIDMTADDIIIDSNRFNVDSKGNMSCSNANITGGDVTLKSESDSVSKLRVETDDENVYTEIRPAGVRTVYNGTILFWANATGTVIRNSHGKTVLFAGNSIYIDDDYSSNQYPISLTGSDGNISCVTLTQTSSEENKKDFEKLENALDIIKATDIYKYRFKNEDENHKKHIGFVIGNDFNYSEEITSANNNEVEIYSMLSVTYKAIQEQQEEIETLKNEINKLKEMIKNGI